MIEGFSTPDIFKDQSKLSFDYIPDELLYRDEEAKRLVNMLRPVMKKDLSQHILITGSVGTGKTLLAKRFCSDFQEVAAERKLNLQYIHVNCRQRRTETMVISKIVKHFQPHFPDRGFTVHEMLRILMRDVKKNKCKLLIVLDEVDELIRNSGCTLVYSLCRFNEEEIYLKGSASLILISQKNIFDMLDPATLSTIKRTNRINLGKYDKKQLWGIVEKRADLAFCEGIVEMEVPELIAGIAAEWGDARYAIELLETGGMIAQGEGSRYVNAEHVRSARASTYQNITVEKLEPLSLHRKLTFLAIARALRNSTYVSSGDVENVYHIVCEEYGEMPRKYTQYWKYINGLIDLGFVDARSVTKGIRGTTRHITISDVPVKHLSEQLVELIEKELVGRK